MDNLGKCHGKINIMIGLKANGNSSNWLPTAFCGTYDVHMSITNNLSTENNKGKCCICFQDLALLASPKTK